MSRGGAGEETANPAAGTTPVRHTPLYETHRALGARFVPFAGWEMPVQYAGIIREHQAVRRQAGLFDVSHMGEIEIRGAGAAEVCQQVTVNDIGRLRDGHVQYSLLCLPSGGVIDDLTVHRLAADRYLLCVNAANTAKDLEWIRAHAGGQAEVVDRSAEYAQLALQGPAATAILASLTAAAIASLRPFRFSLIEVAGVDVLAARTGYTGEDGWELYCPPSGATKLWGELLEAGRSRGLVPAGLGARDTLRLERALPLYGHELHDATTPLEAGLGWVVSFATAFIGREALQKQQAHGVQRRLVGLTLLEPGVPRQGYALRADGKTIGTVTSGTHSPTLGKPIALGYVTALFANKGARVEMGIRNRTAAAEVVALPFYKRR